jgi:spore photoproduct lyase
VAFRKIYVHREAVRDAVTRHVLDRLPGVPLERVSDDPDLGLSGPGGLKHGKRILYLTRSRGSTVKSCPGTLSPYLCCGYTVINQTLQCPMDCTYCILQLYLNNPCITVYTDIQKICQEVDTLLASEPRRFFRFGTGELGDSLVLDRITGLSSRLIGFFSGKRNCLLELKTKAAWTPPDGKRRHRPVVISWSLNPRQVARRDERGAAPVRARLEAARRCQDKGYLLGFHLDPILFFPGWREAYRELLEELFLKIDPAGVSWISLGSLRYPPYLKEIIRVRFPEADLVNEEMIRGLDGKMRYPRPLREELYSSIYGGLRDWGGDGLWIYFCMEPPWVWKRVMGRAPADNAELDYGFAKSLWNRFPFLHMDEPCQEEYITGSGRR